jgi:hypothetical protein
MDAVDRLLGRTLPTSTSGAGQCEVVLALADILAEADPKPTQTRLHNISRQDGHPPPFWKKSRLELLSRS